MNGPIFWQGKAKPGQTLKSNAKIKVIQFLKIYDSRLCIQYITENVHQCGQIPIKIILGSHFTPHKQMMDQWILM